MRRTFWVFAVITALAVVIYTQSVSLQRYGERRSRAAARSSKDIVVGVCWPFSVNKDDMADGVTLAQDEINARGGASGRRFQLIVRDSRLSSAVAKQITLEFASNPEVTAVLGYYDDDLAVEASPVYEESSLLHIIIGGNNSFMTSHGFRYIVHTVLTNDKIGKKLAHLVMRQNYRKCAIIWEEDGYGEDLAYHFQTALDEDTLVFSRSYARVEGKTEFRDFIDELRSADPDIIFFAGLEPWAGDFFRTARQARLQTPVLGAFSDTPSMLEAAGPALEGAVFFDFYDPRASSPENQVFVAKFRKRFGRDPDTFAAQAYDAMMLLAAAVEKTHSANPLDLSYAIRFMDAWTGVNGVYKFDSRGELMDKPIYLKQIRSGRAVTIEDLSPQLFSAQERRGS
jgi:branched-chain amino acid transport system substrate-binding protein